MQTGLKGLSNIFVPLFINALLNYMVILNTNQIHMQFINRCVIKNITHSTYENTCYNHTRFSGYIYYIV
jgi:hypothetical protein